MALSRGEPAPSRTVDPSVSALPPILLIDDDADDLFITRRLLLKAKVENKVVAMEDPVAAVDYLEMESHNSNRIFIPCVVITDLHMPAKSGLDITRWIRRHRNLRSMPVVVMTDSESADDEQAAKDAGATRFVRKFPTSHGFGLLIGGLPCRAAGA